MDFTRGFKHVGMLLMVYTFSGAVFQIGSSYVCGDEKDVVFICNNSSTHGYKGTVYLDTARVPVAETSQCYCDLEFKTDQGNQVAVTLSIHGTANSDNIITMMGLDKRFSTAANGTNGINFNVGTGRKNNLSFTIKKESSDSLNACLRIRELISDGSNFRVRCFQSATEHIKLGNPSTDNEKDQGLGAVVGGAVGGAVLVIIGVIVIIIVIKKRKKTPTKDTEDYYMTENAMYHDNRVPAVSNQRQSEEYAIIDSTLTHSPAYSVVNKNKGNSNTTREGTPQHNTENEYNHLNEVTHAFATGNVYSTTGNEYSSTGNGYPSTGKGYSSTGNEYSSTRNEYSSTGNDNSSIGNEYSSTGNEYLSTGNEYSSTGNGNKISGDN